MNISQEALTALFKCSLERNLTCKLCDESITSGCVSFKTDDGTAVHCDCLEEHCVSTNCLGCKIGKYPDCAFRDMKKVLMKNGKENKSNENPE